jgi:hypothetical protein
LGGWYRLPTTKAGCQERGPEDGESKSRRSQTKDSWMYRQTRQACVKRLTLRYDDVFTGVLQVSPEDPKQRRKLAVLLRKLC